jgi:hypothetical protein
VPRSTVQENNPSAADTAGGMTTGDGGDSCMILGGGAGSKIRAGMGGREAVATVASWGLAAAIPLLVRARGSCLTKKIKEV